MFVDSRFDAFKEDLLQHIDRKFDEQRHLFMSAFPDGDPILHCEYHKEQIELMKSRKALNRAVLEKLVSGGAWSALLAMAAALGMPEPQRTDPAALAAVMRWRAGQP